MADLSLAANRPVNWNVLVPNSQNLAQAEQQLKATDIARARGAEVVALTVPQPMTIRINLHAGFVFDAIYNWARLFRMPIEERIAFLKKPANRKQLAEDAQNPASPMHMLARWELFTVDQVHSPKLRKYKGRTIGDIAKELGKAPLDALLDIAIEDDLLTYFMPPTMGTDDATWEMRAKLWKDDRTIIGASDAGAHLDMIDTFAFSSQVLGEGVRKRKLISLEDAIHQLTEVPAKYYGLKERGRVEVGWYADLVVFDPETIGLGDTYTKFDLPGGAGRLYADAKGIDHVFANGVEIVAHGKDTGARPGTVLRSGRHTRTVEVPGGRAA